MAVSPEGAISTCCKGQPLPGQGSGWAELSWIWRVWEGFYTIIGWQKLDRYFVNPTY
jgi:hypothetical protein